MSKFFPGQPVRVVCPGSTEHGRETRVRNPNGAFPDGGPAIEVDIPCRHPWIARYCAFESDELVPILPSGHRSGDYSYTELMDRLKAGEVECV